MIRLIALAFLLAGCGDRPVLPGKATGGDWYQWEHMSIGGPLRFHDEELKVTCWQFGGVGVFCMTDDQLGR
jgi:hypothetical protein